MNTLRELRARWNTLIEERLESLFLITPSTVIDAKRLMGGIESLLSEHAIAFLTPIETSDLNEALQCLLVGSATGAEVMTLRAAENFLRRWYELESGNPAGRKGWATLLQWFNKTYPERQDVQAELALLNYMNIRRNQLAHPDQISDSGSAQTTLMNVCMLIKPVGKFLTHQQPASQSGTGSSEQ